MPGHVEGDHAMVPRDARIVHQGTILAPVGAGGVQAQQRGTLARFLDIETVRPAEQIEMHIAAGDRLEFRAHAAPPAARSLASASLK